MKKIISTCTIALITALSIFAGDVAVFNDIGFSEDGQTYIFGQYGKRDKTYEGWAEIFTVDVEKNDYIPGEIFSTKPNSSTQNLSGKRTFEILQDKATWKISKYKCSPAESKNLLYVRSDESKKNTDEIVFKDFDNSTDDNEIYYHIELVPTYEGKGSSTKSSYFISLERQDGNGNIISRQTVGTPSIKRKGITSYQINRIFSDKTGKSIVFIIEKTLEDDTGTSVRYMVETVKLN